MAMAGLISKMAAPMMMPTMMEVESNKRQLAAGGGLAMSGAVGVLGGHYCKRISDAPGE